MAQRLFWKYSNITSKSNFKKSDYDALDALKCVISYNKYGGYCVPNSSRHRPAAQKILFNKVHEAKTIEYMVSKSDMNGEIVHAGTYFGDFLPALSKNLPPPKNSWVAFASNFCKSLKYIIYRAPARHYFWYSQIYSPKVAPLPITVNVGRTKNMTGVDGEGQRGDGHLAPILISRELFYPLIFPKSQKLCENSCI